MSNIRKVLFAFALVCCALGSVGALEPPVDPQLRIEAGMHTAVINRIGADAKGRWAVTSSDDKSLRIWDLQSGRLVRVIRPPQAPEDEGKLYTCAISPDGNLVAAGGWTKIGATAGHAVYVFERASGKMIKRLTGCPNVVNHLDFSPDGKWLAGGLGSGRGLRVWDLNSTAVPLIDGLYNGGGIYGIDWTRDGRVVTTSEDGKIRLYKPSADGINRVADATARGGEPNGIAFSPDGKTIAVGFYDSINVELYDGNSLQFIQRMPVPSSSDNLEEVAFSADGKFLYAGGNYSNPNVVRCWPLANPDQFWDVSAEPNAITSLVPLADGRVLVASATPGWGYVMPDRSYKQIGNPPTADFRDQLRNLSLSDDARRIQFGYAYGGKEPWTFDLVTRKLSKGGVTSMRSPDLSSIQLQNWEDRPNPTLNGKILDHRPYELTRSYSVVPGAQSLVVGADWYLRHFDKAGEVLWAQAVPSVPWAVNTAANGKVVVAACGDGTIRWFRVSDGKELLAFFPHGDQKRWVLWTPSGYFDASPGGEDLIGWHLNNGQDNAGDFYPASKFRVRYCRPDIIDRVLETLDEAEAVRLANDARGGVAQPTVSVAQALPPVVDLVSAAEVECNTPSLTVSFKVRSPAASPVTAIRSRVDGQMAATKGLQVAPRADDVQTLTVSIPQKDCEIQVFAENANGVSVPATVRVRWTGSSGQFVIKPKLYVLAVGVGAYNNKDIPRLALSAKDARDFAAAIQRQQGKLYSKVEVRLLTDADATDEAILDGLTWLERQVTQHDVGMLFLSGHGLNDATKGYVYLPVNADPERIRSTCVDMDEFQDTLASLAGKAVVFLDTCHSGNVLGPARRAMDSGVDGVINALSSAENGVVVFSSSTGRQYSLESPEWGNGAFTKALLEGLGGMADFQRTGTITFKMLDLYISERVKVLTSGQQSPVTQSPGGVPDFPLAIK